MNNKTTIVAPQGKQEIFVTREFAAPRELVYKTFSDSALFSQWMGCRNMSMEVDRYEFKDGGYYRYVDTDPNGNKNGTHGMFHEVLAPQRIIQTFEYEGLPETGHVILRTITFESLPGSLTKLVIHSLFQSMADREGMMASGIEKGVNESHERLDELLESILNYTI
jgi:uncharacterized protein YndB with AHSA1/START domain